jgi:hypothetical protein
MQYPLPESIGNPGLLVGREKEFALLDQWISRMPKLLSKSRAFLGRRKSGKTAIVQRIFNRLWSENGPVIPFYINIREKKVWYPDFAIEYYRTFASQYISFLERNEKLITQILSLDQIREYGASKNMTALSDDVELIQMYHHQGISHDQMWHTACSAPHRYAVIYGQRILTIIDEFQNTGEYIYRDQECRDVKEDTIPGTWHDLSESKYAPMLATGSYVGWLLNVLGIYLEGGRLKLTRIAPYLTSDEGLQAVYQYAEYYGQAVTNETAVLINSLCMSDPFFISCVILNDFEGKELLTERGVVNAVHYEITNRDSELSKTWGEYIELSLKRINTVNSKNILLHLSKYPGREWTPRELKAELNLDIDERTIHEHLRAMAKADLIQEGASDIRYQGLTDGTLFLILRNRFEEEIESFQPDLKKDFYEEIEKLKRDKKSLQGMINHLTGKFAEFQLLTEFRSQKRFPLSRYFQNVKDDTVLNITDVSLRVKFHRPDGKEMEIDVLAESDCGRVITAEVKKTKEPVGLKLVHAFHEKIRVYASLRPANPILAVFLSVGGFTDDALAFCKQSGIATAEQIEVFEDK